MNEIFILIFNVIIIIILQRMCSQPFVLMCLDTALHQLKKVMIKTATNLKTFTCTSFKISKRAIAGSPIGYTKSPVGSCACNSSLLRSHMRLKKNRPYNHWLKSQGHYLLCFSVPQERSEPIRFACDMRLEPVTA